MQEMSKDEENINIYTLNNFEGKLCRRAFRFCEKYRNGPYSDITFSLNDQKALHIHYNDFL